MGTSRWSRRKDERPRNRSRLAYAVIAVLVISSIGIGFALSPSVKDSPPDYEPHVVIIIDGDAQLQARALAEGWPGNGTETNPYTIEGYEIGAIGHDSAISVSNTNRHLVVEDCYLRDATFSSLLLQNVTNVTIVSTEFSNGQRCISISYSRLVSLVGNNCTSANEGINVSGSERVTIVANNCSSNLVGLTAQACSNLSIRANVAYNNLMTGIQVSDSRHFVLANNSCLGGQVGIHVTLSEHGSVINSTLINSSNAGMYIGSCDDCSVESNRCTGRGSFGISIEGSSDCRVTGNYASNNWRGIRGLACDGLDVRENQCWGNRWQGMFIEDCDGCSVVENYLHGNDGDGLVMDGCNDGWAERNRCEGNGGSGLVCLDGIDCHVGGNNCTDNGDCGIRCHGLVQGEITGNDARGCLGDGVLVTMSSGTNVSDNNCSEDRAGIRFHQCDSCHAYNNTIVDSVYGIAVSYSTGLVLRRNALTDDGVFIEGAALGHWTTHEIGPTNSVNGLQVLYLVSEAELEVEGTYAQVLLADCSGVIVDGLNLSHATVGVAIGFSDGVTVSNSTCSGGFIGVYGSRSRGLVVENSDFGGNARSGVEMEACDGCEVRMVTCEENVQYGVRLNGSTDCESDRCQVSGSGEGFSVAGTASAGSIQDSEASNCTIGVSARSAEMMTLYACAIRDCDFGVFLADSESIFLLFNSLVDCGLYIESDVMSCWDSHSISPGNTVNGGQLVYLVGASDASVSSSAGQVVLVGCSQVTASSLDLSNSSVGVLAGFSDHLEVLDCNLSGNVFGAELFNCTDCSIASNDITDCASEGVLLTGSSWNMVEDNEILRCAVGIGVREGISMSTGNSMTGNNVSGCFDGITVSNSPGNAVDENKVMSSLGCGVVVSASNRTVLRNNTCTGSGDAAISLWSSDGCTVANNSCALNLRGIYLWSALGCNLTGNFLYGNDEYGVCVDSSSSANLMWCNVFAYNNGSAEFYDPSRAQACDDGIDNLWNLSGTPCGTGNYWHDWTAPDEDTDGTVDAPYSVFGSAGAKDYYPLATISEPPEPPLEGMADK